MCMSLCPGLKQGGPMSQPEGPRWVLVLDEGADQVVQEASLHA